MKKYILSILLLFTIGIGISLWDTSDPREEYSLTIHKELKAFQELLPVETSDEKAMGQPDMAALQEYYQVMDPAENRVPQERLVTAYKAMKNMQEAHPLKSMENLVWENIPSNMGGRTRALMWDPNSNAGNRVWAGSVTGGLWYNNDITEGFSSWHAVDDFMSSLSISCLTYDPNNTQTFYAGTGEAPTAIITYRESSGRGVGIWKSEDGGQSWNLLESTSDFAYITDMEVRDEDGESVIYAGVASGKYMGADHPSQPNDGLFRSSDGGETWEQVLPNITGLNIPFTPSDVEIGADGRIYIGSMRNIDGNGGAVILFSDDGTQGSWTLNETYKNQIEAGIGQYYLPGRVMLAAAPSDENVVYALIGAGYENGFGYYHGNFVLRSDDKGENWVQKNLPGNNPTWASLSWHAFTIEVDPNNPDHFFLGGLDQYHSLNGGNSYSHVSDWALMYYGGGDEYIHADQHVIKFKPGSSEEVIFGSDGGVFYTNNATQSYPDFQEMNHFYSSLQFYTCDIHPDAGTEEYLGGLQDNGTLYYEGSPLDINDMIQGGDGAYCFIDENNGDISIASYYYNRYTVFENGNDVSYIGNNETGTFVCPADLDSDNHILYANGVGFFGQNSNRLFRAKNLPYSPNVSLVNLGTNINTWFTSVILSKYSPLGKSTLYMGSNAGHLFKVEEAQDNPLSTDIGSSDFPTGAISCVAIGGSEDTLLVTFSNYGVSSIWQSYNGGGDWQEVEGNLPDMPVRWALYHPASSKEAMIATELGVWVCADLSVENPEWFPAIEGMANVRVDMLQMRENDFKVIAASHGRGLFTTDFNYVPVGLNKISQNDDFSVSPNPSNGKFFVELSDTKTSAKTLQIHNIQGLLVAEYQYHEEKCFVDLSNHSAGTYVLTLKTSNNHYSKKILIQ